MQKRYYSGSKGVKSSLEDNARNKAKGQKFTFKEKKDKEASRFIAEKISINRYVWNATEENKSKGEKLLRRNRAEAIHYFINQGSANKLQTSILGISEKDLLFEKEFIEQLRAYINDELDESTIFKAGLVQRSKGGHLVSYNRLQELNDESMMYFELKEMLNTSKNDLPEKYDKYGNEIEREPEETPEEKRLLRMLTGEQEPERITERECNIKIWELEKAISKEKYKIGAEFNEPANLCYYLLYDIIMPSHCKTDEEAFLFRLSKLRKSSLIILVKESIKIFNRHNKKQIDKTNATKKKMNRPKKSTTASDKKILVQMGKGDGMKQTEVAKQIPCDLSTVKRYWN